MINSNMSNTNSNINNLNEVSNGLKKRNIFTSLLILLMLLIIPLFTGNTVEAETNELGTEEVYVYVFSKEGCPKCASLKMFISEYAKEYSIIKVKIFEKANVPGTENNKLLNKVRDIYNVESTGYPLTIIGGKYVLGYSSNREAEIKKYVEYYSNKEHVNVINKIILGDEIKDEWIEPETKFDIPILGEVSSTDVSLFLLSVIVGFADGINPCGMWVLLFIISLIIPTQDKKKIWVLGGGFILTSGVFYFLMMMSWISIVNNFAGNKIFIIISGIIALVAGGWNLYKYIKSRIKKEEGCDVTSAEQKRKISKKLKNLINEGNIWIALVGVVGITLFINLFELACSAGWPYIFTTILAENKLSFGGELFYILIYVIFFLIDDLIIFTIAVLTLRIKAVSNKLSKYAHLIGGILMILFGIMMIFFRLLKIRGYKYDKSKFRI